MTRPKKDVKFQHNSSKDARKTSRTSDALDPSADSASPTRNGQATKPEVSRNESYDGNWTDDDKASIARKPVTVSTPSLLTLIVTAASAAAAERL